MLLFRADDIKHTFHTEGTPLTQSLEAHLCLRSSQRRGKNYTHCYTKLITNFQKSLMAQERLLVSSRRESHGPKLTLPGPIQRKVSTDSNDGRYSLYLIPFLCHIFYVACDANWLSTHHIF